MAVHRCTQCGTARRGDLQVCVRCETPFADAELPGPAASAHTQSHGTVLALVLVGFLVLAVLLKLSIRGIGPFEVRLVESRTAGDTLEMTLEITNTGDRKGRANCRIPLRDDTDVVQTPKLVITAQVDPGQTIREVVNVPVGNGVRPFGSISC